MNRRTFVRGFCSCATAALAGCVADNNRPITGGSPELAPGYRPASSTDEGGLWAQMERAEADLKRSRFLVQDPATRAYVNDIACRLSKDFCPDLRVYVVNTPYFNAMMAPNGMMQIWTGLLLRVQNEAQLAAVIGHEMGHYLRRHSLQRWRDARNKTDFAAFFAFAGVPGMIAQFGVLASIFSFSREQEREADAVGLDLMAKAGYRPLEAVSVWEQLIAEQKAAGVNRSRSVFFASHPEPEERVESLRAQAVQRTDPMIGDGIQYDRFRYELRTIRTMLLADELKLRQFDQSEVVFDLLLKAHPESAEIFFYKGEIYRQRNADGDRTKAYAAYERSIVLPGTPPETYRSLGLIQMRDKDYSKAEVSFRRYLELHPHAPDRVMILSYIQRQS